METLRAGNKEKPAFVASHDSATAMVMALGDFLKEKEFKGVGAVPSNELYAKFVNSIPAFLRKKFYSWSGKVPAIPAGKVGDIDASEIDRWICSLYPKRRYPAVAIGSCNGAAIHFCAAMGIPWLPQTVLMPIDKGKSFPVDEPKKTMEWGKEPAKAFLDNNPGWQLHHMMDPNQDRLRVGSVGYFRVKKTRLGKYYKKFLEERLEPTGRIIMIDCSFDWPVHKINDRHFFQLGGLGGLSPEEYYHGSEKVRDFLRNAGAEVTQWDAPKIDLRAPEAEWGLEKMLAKEVQTFAKDKGIAVTTLSFQHPQDLSAPVADVFRWWYREQGVSPDRLLVETFNVIAPYQCLRKRCIPYWLAFIVDRSAADLESYLEDSRAFEEIYLMVLSHGKKSVGSTPVSRWEELMQRALKKSDFIGTNPAEYPLDLAVYARYNRDLKKKISVEYELPVSLPVQEAIDHLQKFAGGKISFN